MAIDVTGLALTYRSVPPLLEFVDPRLLLVNAFENDEFDFKYCIDSVQSKRG